MRASTVDFFYIKRVHFISYRLHCICISWTSLNWLVTNNCWIIWSLAIFCSFQKKLNHPNSAVSKNRRRSKVQHRPILYTQKPRHRLLRPPLPASFSTVKSFELSFVSFPSLSHSSDRIRKQISPQCSFLSVCLDKRKEPLITVTAENLKVILQKS